MTEPEQPTGRHAAIEDPAEALTILEETHLIMVNGLCRTCGTYGPCEIRKRAANSVAKESKQPGAANREWLPRRNPGATLGVNTRLVGTKRIA
jgi:hypothetical protein